MPDYQNGKIYSIRCYNNPSLIYIGSTCQKLSRRFTDHKKDFQRKPNVLIYKTMNENGGFENFYIEIIENYPCENLEQLNKREGEVLRDIGNMTMNKLMPGTFAGKTQAEYDRERSKTDHRKQYNKKYNEYYMQEHKEEQKDYHKCWYQQNKEKQLEDVMKRYNEKKEEINAQKAIKVTCECGSCIRKGDLNKHKKSQKHINFINSNII